MTWKKITAIAISFAIATATSCGPVKDCDDTGKSFYKHLKDRDYDAAIQMLDPEAINNTPVEVWKDGLAKKDRDLGMILSVERRDFESQTSDNVTKMAIKYKVTYSEGTMYERIEFIERDHKFNITYYRYDEDSTIVD